MNWSGFAQWLKNNAWFGENSRQVNKMRHYDGLPFEQRTAMSMLSMPDSTRVYGVDISHWNLPPVNIRRMKDEFGLTFVIIKGCDGSLRSRNFADHVRAAQEAQVPWGFYDWLYPNKRVSIESQTTAWANQAHEFQPPMGIFIDAEWTMYAGMEAYPNANDLQMAHDQMKAKFGPAITYTAKGYADTWLKGFDWTNKELWVAHYGVNNPALPAGASSWTLWQFTSTLDGKQLDPNGNAELDGNYFRGTFDEFYARFAVTIPPPPTGGTMYTGKTITIAKIWSAIGGGQIAEIPAGVEVTGDAPRSDGYVYLRSPKTGYTKKIWLSNYIQIVTSPPPAPEPEPDPGLPDLPIDIILGDDVTYIKQTVHVLLKAK